MVEKDDKKLLIDEKTFDAIFEEKPKLSPYQEKTRGAQKCEHKQINTIVCQAGIQDRHAFGDFIEEEKALQGRGASANFSYDELVHLAKEYQTLGGK
jgi:hypothetical protein